MRAQTEKTTFTCKDEAHTALDIFSFAVFFYNPSLMMLKYVFGRNDNVKNHCKNVAL